MLSEEFIKKYYNYVKEKASQYLDPNSCINQESKARAKFFANISPDELISQLVNIQNFFKITLEVTFIDQKGLLHYPLNQYVFLLLLSTLLNLYSNKYLGIISMLDKIFNLEIQEAKRFKEIYEFFLSNTEELKKFINSHQYIQGFQISTSEFYQGEKKVLQNMEEYIKLLQEKKDVKIFRKNSENFSFEENSKNIEIIEGRSSLQRLNTDFAKFNEDDLKLLEDDEPIESSPDKLEKVEKNKLVLQTNTSSMRKDDVDIRATILMEYENEDKRFSPLRTSSHSRQSTREFKFSIVQNEKSYLKDFDNFINHYSKDYKEKDMDMTQYQSSNFELQVRPTIEDKLLRKFTNENMFVDEDTEFIIIKEFDEKIFNEMNNGYSKDFKFHRNIKISKDDNEYHSKIENDKLMV